MIKAQELTCNNWIDTINGDEQVVDVLCDSVNTTTLQNGLYDNIRPIELTPELLGKIKGCNLTLDGKHTTKWGISDGNRYIGVAYYKGDKKWSAAWGDE